MCGIYGILGPKANGIENAHIEKIFSILRHRGPDEQNFEKNKNHLLVHLRLSILDLSPNGSQPLKNDQGSLLFNGEIYNYVELAKKINFKATGDTQLLYKLLQTEPFDYVVKQLDGMFAFCYVDKKNNKGYLARDAFGEKPLYYTKFGNSLVFSSELKAFKGFVPMEIDQENLYYYFRGASIPAPLTAFKGVYKLEPGHYLEWDLDGNYMSPKIYTYYTPVLKEYSESSEELVHKIRTSIELRCRADVPVGVFLSGGYDSSTIAYFQQRHQGNVKAFSVGLTFDHKDSNEVEFARGVAKELKVDFHDVLLTEDDFIKTAASLSGHLDDFICDPVIVPLSAVSALAKSEGMKVVLGGEGADEIFGGYRNYAKAYNAQQFLKFARPLLFGKLSFQQWEWGFPRVFEDYYQRLSQGYDLFLTGSPCFSDRLSSRIVHGKPSLRAEKWRSKIISDYPDARLDQRIQVSELFWRLPELLLMRLDFITMKHSLEVRAPFLSKEIVEAGLGLQAKQKWEGPKRTKLFFKETLNPYLPQSVKRPKQGFCGNARSMLSLKIKDYLKTYFFDSMKGDDFFDSDLTALFEKRFDDLNSFQVWNLYSFALVKNFWKS